MDVVERTVKNLETKVVGYRDLTKPQRSILEAFPLGWAMFEERCLERHATPSAIKDFVNNSKPENIAAREVLDAFDYFHHRYFVGTYYERRFHTLCFGRASDLSDNRGEGVRKRLSTLQKTLVPSERDKAEFALLVVYRLRNNLLHGNKLDNIADQNENLVHGLLMMNHFVEHCQ